MRSTPARGAGAVRLRAGRPRQLFFCTVTTMLIKNWCVGVCDGQRHEYHVFDDEIQARRCYAELTKAAKIGVKVFIWEM